MKEISVPQTIMILQHVKLFKPCSGCICY